MDPARLANSMGAQNGHVLQRHKWFLSIARIFPAVSDLIASEHSLKRTVGVPRGDALRCELERAPLAIFSNEKTRCEGKPLHRPEPQMRRSCSKNTSSKRSCSAKSKMSIGHVTRSASANAVERGFVEPEHRSKKNLNGLV